jgi:hypothetical protein
VNINFQQVYENELEEVTKELLQYPRHYSDLPHEVQRLVEDLITAGYQRALDDALDPAVLEETSALSKEMSSQLTSMSTLIESFLSQKNNESTN